MYFTVRGYSPYIGRSFMNGEQHEILIQNSSIVKWPEGLAIDYTSKKDNLIPIFNSNIIRMEFILLDFLLSLSELQRITSKEIKAGAFFFFFFFFFFSVCE